MQVTKKRQPAILVLLAAAACGSLLASCARDAPHAAEGMTARDGGRGGAEAAPAEASGGGWEVDPETSWVVAVTGKSGAFGFLGHQHAVLVTDWKAEVDWRPRAAGESRARFVVPAASLRIDSQNGRKLAGLGEGPDADTVKKLQTKVLDGEHLAAEAHPELVFAVTGVKNSGEKGGLAVDGELTVRDKTRQVSFPVEVTPQDGGAVRFSGEFTVKHTDFGIEPESVAGVVKVADPVSIRFQVTLRPH